MFRGANVLATVTTIQLSRGTIRYNFWKILDKVNARILKTFKKNLHFWAFWAILDRLGLEPKRDIFVKIREEIRSIMDMKIHARFTKKC
jgi:hypothetical protein